MKFGERIESLKKSKGLGEKKNLGQFELKDKFFDEEKMYVFVEREATERNYIETLNALPFARECHKGQFRKGNGAEKVPYIIHPLTLACHALALELGDEVVATCLLHDTVEDCNVTLDELPVKERIRDAVKLVTKVHSAGEDREAEKKKYFEDMKTDSMAMLVKLLDRCNNISSMSMGFTKEKMAEQIHETEKYVMPLFECLRQTEPAYRNACFIIKYQMMSVMEALKRTIQ